MNVPRCSWRHDDGRRCTLPTHLPDGPFGQKHLLAADPLTIETLVRIAREWGLPPRLAQQAARGVVDGARRGGGSHLIEIDNFIRFAIAVRDATDRIDREAWGANDA